MDRLRKALEQIAELGGNLPDDRLTTRTGPNDAAHRGLMYCEARRIAREALAASGEPLPKYPALGWSGSRPPVFNADNVKHDNCPTCENGDRPNSHNAPDEHLPTLEGVIEYLENQNDLAFLAYRRLSGGSEPGMQKDVRARLTEFAYEAWQGVGEALQKAKQAAKINHESVIAR